MHRFLVVIAVCAVVLTAVVVLREVQHQADRNAATQEVERREMKREQQLQRVLASDECQQEVEYYLRDQLNPAGGGHCYPFRVEDAAALLYPDD